MPINASLRHLRCFAAVAREGSFTLAARRLFITQSSLTTAIQQLEEAVGLKLFDRTTRRVSLTREGASFVPVAERLLNEFDAAVADVRSVAERQRGHVSMVAAPSVVAQVLAPVIAGYSRAYPNISVAVSDGAAELIQQRVLAAEADFGITSRWAEEPALLFRPILRDHFGVVCKADHPLGRSRADIAWRRLQRERYIGFAADTGIRTMLHSRPDLPRILHSPQYEVSSTGSLYAMLDAGLGVSVLPALAANLEPLERLFFRELCEPRLEREICLITRRGRTLSPSAQSMVEAILNYLQTWALPAGVSLAGDEAIT
jgi:DNA-binding transcriptional LysR family regulator